jgi:Holliday junction resolvasome RuvABC ATP-dependent DNA helicase subunit
MEIASWTLLYHVLLSALTTDPPLMTDEMSQAAVEETSGAALVAGGLTQIKANLKKLEKGGVLFIDEAYQLDPAKNPLGAQVRMNDRIYSQLFHI